MPLDKTRLGRAMATAVKNLRPSDGTSVTDAQLENIWIDLADEIIMEIKNNGTVSTTVTVTTPAGPGAGTGTGTIT